MYIKIFKPVYELGSVEGKIVCTLLNTTMHYSIII